MSPTAWEVAGRPTASRVKVKKKAVFKELVSETAYWHEFHSVTTKTRRQCTIDPTAISPDCIVKACRLPPFQLRIDVSLV